MFKNLKVPINYNKMSKQVSREKYEKLKAAANGWMKECQILKDRLESIQELEQEIFHLEEENEILKNNFNGTS